MSLPRGNNLEKEAIAQLQVLLIAEMEKYQDNGKQLDKSEANGKDKALSTV